MGIYYGQYYGQYLKHFFRVTIETESHFVTRKKIKKVLKFRFLYDSIKLN